MPIFRHALSPRGQYKKRYALQSRIDMVRSEALRQADALN